ncbi:MAG: lysoplasmalogenase [Bacteroidota bacterium]
MEAFLYKRTLAIFWIVLLIHCLFQHFQLPYVAVTKPMLVPLLFVFILMRDQNISSPRGKFFFYIGLILAFFGDVLLIFINDTFFLSGMIAFMLMNLLYGTAFLHMNKLSIRSIVPVGITVAFLAFIGNAFYQFLGDDMGDYKIPILAYMFTISIMITLAVNVAGNNKYRKATVSYLIPGVLVFLIENVLVAANKFHFGHDKDIFVAVMLTYGLAQYLMVKGIVKAYL